MLGSVIKKASGAVLALILAVGSVAPASAATKDISDVVNTFNWKYFNQLENDGTNQFYSPYGISEVVALASNGGSNAEKKAVQKKTGVSSIAKLNKLYKNFNKSLKTNYTSGRLFKNSNVVLIDKTAEAAHNLNSNFSKVVKSTYNGTVKIYDIYGDVDGAKSYLKNYVKKATNSFIPNYNSILNKLDVVDIMNVVYFKGDWAEPFDARNTTTMDFVTATGRYLDADMMINTSNIYGYYENKDFVGVSLPYKLKDSNHVVSMDIIIPTCTTCPKMMIRWQKLSNTKKEAFLNKIKTKANRKVCIYLPKFTIDKKYNMTSYITSYTGGSNFNGILNDFDARISNVQHQAKVKVDELGTEAAAVTEMTMDMTAIADKTVIKVVKCDRPFIFVIRDDKTGTELFTGVVNTLQ